jgi:hypothetical protein
MRRSLKILVVVAALALTAVGIMGIAGADEALADGTYSLTVPGIGMLTLNVVGSTVTVSSPNAAFNGQTATMTEDSELVLSSAALSIKIEADDGALTGEYTVDLGTLNPGDNMVTVGDLTFTLTLNDDGSLSASGLPDGYTAMTTEDGLKIVTPDGIITIKAEDGTFTASAQSTSPDDSKDEYTNDDSKDEEVSSDSKDTEEVSSEDQPSDQTSTTQDSEDSGSHEGSHDGGDD